ncbi:hypothetical protein LJR013_003199 [Pseudarthrobacter oxydans]|uniref:hypothetical protein n=1 Tax=Pseudarthrobacter oxydans TaxID=1671 RepID=UPI003ECE8C62
MPQISVTKTDIEKEWRPLTEQESTIIPGLSSKAWIRIVAKLPDVYESGIAEDVIKDVMVSMIIRVLKNPDSARIISESIDDSTDSRTLDAAIASGEMYVSADELAMLTPAPVVPFYGMYVLGLGG